MPEVGEILDTNAERAAEAAAVDAAAEMRGRGSWILGWSIGQIIRFHFARAKACESLVRLTHPPTVAIEAKASFETAVPLAAAVAVAADVSKLETPPCLRKLHLSPSSAASLSAASP